MAALSDEMKDERLTQFLSMTEDRVDLDVAQAMLEVVNWDVQAAIEQLFGGPGSPGQSRPNSAVQAPSRPPPDGDMGFGERQTDMGGHFMDMSRPHGMDDGGSEVGPGLGGGVPNAAGGDSMDDAHLAAAIEASYRVQTTEGRAASEEELIAQALRMSQQEEEARQRQELRQQQEAELQESVLMDQMREQSAREEREAAAALAQAEEQSKQEEEKRTQVELEAKRARLGDEPAAGEAGRLMLMVRLPNGQRLQRAFRASDAVGRLYDYVDLQNEELAGQRYRLVSTMPRKAYEDRQPTLSESGIQNQFVLLVELQSGL